MSTNLIFYDEEKRRILFDPSQIKLIKEYIDNKKDITLIIDDNDTINPYSIENLDLLNDLDIENLVIIYFNEGVDFSGIYLLKNLLSLDTFFNKLPIDFSKFKKLRNLECVWDPKSRELFSLVNLNALFLKKYKPKSYDLDGFNNFRNLEELTISESNIKSLKGIEDLEPLKKITLAYNSKLYIDSNEFVFSQVEELNIESCKTIDVDFVYAFPNLKKLTYENNSELETLKPILDNLKSLEDLNFVNTKVKESDNRYWKDYKNIKTIHFSDRRHQLLKLKDFNN